MKRRLLTQASVVVMVFAIAVVPVLAAQVFVEGFGDSALDTDGTAITTSNTSFTYVRTGSGGGSIESQNPSSLGGGVNNSNSMRLGGSSSTSLNGVGVTDDTFSPVMDVTTMNLKMKIESNVATNDAFYITMGDGSSFSGNTVFDTSHLMWGLRIHNGTVEYRTSGGSWNDVSTPATTLSDGTEYHLHIVANRSGSTIENYNIDEDIADGKMDLYIDDNLVANDIDITNNQNATAFRICQINGSTYAEFDNIYIDDTALAPFTPTAVTISSFSATSASVLPWAIWLFAAIVVGLGAMVIHRRR